MRSQLRDLVAGQVEVLQLRQALEAVQRRDLAVHQLQSRQLRELLQQRHHVAGRAVLRLQRQPLDRLQRLSRQLQQRERSFRESI